MSGIALDGRGAVSQEGGGAAFVERFVAAGIQPQPPMHANVLSIAGSDPSGGAGIQADLKAVSANGAYAMAAVTARTAQNTRGVRGVHLVPAAVVAEQVEAVFDDVRVDAVKVGMIMVFIFLTTPAAAHLIARNVTAEDRRLRCCNEDRIVHREIGPAAVGPAQRVFQPCG